MSASSGQELLVAGQVVGVFGIKGWLKVKSFTQPADNLLQYTPWWLAADPAGNDRQEVEVDASQSRPQGYVVHLRGVDDRDQAAALMRRYILVPAESLPPLEDGDYYWHQLTGLTVVSTHGGKESCLGLVSEFLETGANDVMVVAGHADALDLRERLIPYVYGQYISRVDLDAGVIWVDWDPEF